MTGRVTGLRIDMRKRTVCARESHGDSLAQLRFLVFMQGGLVKELSARPQGPPTWPAGLN